MHRNDNQRKWYLNSTGHMSIVYKDTYVVEQHNLRINESCCLIRNPEDSTTYHGNTDVQCEHVVDIVKTTNNQDRNRINKGQNGNQYENNDMNNKKNTTAAQHGVKYLLGKTEKKYVNLDSVEFFMSW
jgi:hypothetical protein